MISANLLRTTGRPFLALALSCFVVPAQADIIATDGDIPANMDAGGTEGNPAEYILGDIGAYSLSFTDTDSYVGNTESWNAFTIQSGSEFAVSGNSPVGNLYVGYSGSSTFNIVNVTGMNSQVLLDRGLYVGLFGYGNNLRIENSGGIQASSAVIGGGSSSNALVGNDNQVIITGGTSWLDVSGSLVVGGAGDGNRLSIENGGSVSVEFANIGDHSSSNNNEITVAGTDSLFESVNYVNMGGSSNTLTVENGGMLTASALNLGNSASSANNSALVTGTDSSVFVDGTISVGSAGSDTCLRVENGAKVESVGAFNIGSGSSSDSTWGNRNSVAMSGTSFLDVGGNLRVGSYGNGNDLTINGGSEVVVDGSVSIGSGSSGSISFGNENAVSVTGSGARIDIGASLSIGSNGSDNAFSISEGAIATVVGILNVGVGSSSNADPGNRNVMIITGEDSRLQAEMGLGVGSFGSANRFEVEAGAQAIIEGTVSVGSGSVSNASLGTNNEVQIDGEGTTLSIGGNLIVGDFGSSNSMIAANGSSTTVTGATSFFDPGGIFVGRNGNENSFQVQTGAQVTTPAQLSIGGGTQNNTTIGNNNSVIVSNSGSMLSIGDDLTIGTYGSGNSLMVFEAALVTVNGDFIISAQSGASSNYLRLNGGYFAWSGDNLTELAMLLGEGKVQVWDLEAEVWTNASSSEYFSFGYFSTDQEAFDFSGYEGLGGYTILTSTVPEPQTTALIISVLGLGYCLIRRSRKA